MQMNSAQYVLDWLEKNAGNGKYVVGDPVESVAYRQGQLDLVDAFRTHVLHLRPKKKLPERK